MARIPTLIEDPNIPGRIIGVNRKRLDEIPYWLLTDLPNNIVTVAARQSSTMQTLILSQIGPMRITNFGIQRSGACRVFLRIQDGSTPRALMNSAIHVDAICGNVGQPYYLPEALYVDEGRTLQAAFTDLSNAPNNIRFVAHGTKWATQQSDPTMERTRQRLEKRQYLSVPYWYTTDGNGPVVVGIGATVVATVTIGQDTHFDLMTLSHVASGLYNINIVHGQTGESLIQGPQEADYQIGSELLFGNGNFPFRFHEPRMFTYGQKLVLTITNRAAGINTIYFAFGGRALTLKMWG
jgi:hypothetical protein